MGNFADERIHLAFGLEADPFNTIRTYVETADKHLQMLEMLLARMGDRCWDPEMVISPAMTYNS